MLALFHFLQPELEMVRRRLDKETSWRKDQFLGFVLPTLNEIDRDFLPALVLLSAHGQGYFGPRALSLAAVFQLIFMASLIHSRVNQGVAMQTLMGDYFYTRFFDLLCRDGNLEFLEPLSRLICHLHLDAARHQKQAAAGPVVCGGAYPEKDSGRVSLATEASRLGSQLGKTGPRETRTWQEIGLMLGRLWNGEAVPPHSCRVIADLPPGPVREGLGEIFLFLNGRLPVKKVMVL